MGLHPEVLQFLAQHPIAMVSHDGEMVQLLDMLNPAVPLQFGHMPPSLTTEPFVFEGVEHLRRTRHNIALLLTWHRGPLDFTRLLSIAGHLIDRAPVAGVEAESAQQPKLQEVSSPKLIETNEPFQKFQSGGQFMWHRRVSQVMLPSEPYFCGDLGLRFSHMFKVYMRIRKGKSDFSPEVCSQLQWLLYLSIFIHRSWGLAGQFGWWLAHPVVVAALNDYDAFIPFTLGSGHRYQQEILWSLEQNVVMLDVRGVPDPQDTTIPTDRRATKLFNNAVALGSIRVADVLRPFPL